MLDRRSATNPGQVLHAREARRPQLRNFFNRRLVGLSVSNRRSSQTSRRNFKKILLRGAIYCDSGFVTTPCTRSWCCTHARRARGIWGRATLTLVHRPRRASAGLFHFLCYGCYMTDPRNGHCRPHDQRIETSVRSQIPRFRIIRRSPVRRRPRTRRRPGAARTRARTRAGSSRSPSFGWWLVVGGWG